MYPLGNCGTYAIQLALSALPQPGHRKVQVWTRPKCYSHTDGPVHLACPESVWPATIRTCGKSSKTNNKALSRDPLHHGHCQWFPYPSLWLFLGTSVVNYGCLFGVWHRMYRTVLPTPATCILALEWFLAEFPIKICRQHYTQTLGTTNIIIIKHKFCILLF